MASRDFEAPLLDMCAAPGGCSRFYYVTCCESLAFGDLLARLPPGSVPMAGQSDAACAGHCCLNWLLDGQASLGLTNVTLAGAAARLPLAFWACQARRAVRRELGLADKDPIGDFFVSYACAQCALSQQLNELDRRPRAAGARLAPADSYEQRWTAAFARIPAAVTAPPPAQRMAPAAQPRPTSPAPRGRGSGRPQSPAPRARAMSPNTGGAAARVTSPTAAARRRVASPSSRRR